MVKQLLEADLQVGAFGMTIDGPTRRLDFPRGEIDNLRGSAGGLLYGAREVVFDKLHTRLDRTHWGADAVSAGDMYLRTADGAVVLAIDRVEMPRGAQITRAAEGGVEIIAAHASLNDVRLTLSSFDALRETRATEVAATALRKAADIPLKQERLRFLDSLTGEIELTLKAVLDLPVVGKRTLDQTLKIPIKDGSLDFRALENSLTWLEGQFVNLGVSGDRLVLSWKVPIFGRSHEVISWQLDADAQKVAAFEKIPLRSLADFRVPSGGKAADATPAASKKKSALRSLTLSGLSVKLSMAAPHSVEIGAGALLFGDDGQPGMVGLALTGSLVHPVGPGGLTGSVSVVDVTAKDLPLGPVSLTVDRLNLGAIEDVTVTFDGFRAIGMTATIHRITATNLALLIGSVAPR